MPKPSTLMMLILLGTAGDVQQLIAAAYDWMREGLCHFHVRTRSAAKTEFVLLSLDGRHALTFDLWQELDQLIGVGSV